MSPQVHRGLEGGRDFLSRFLRHAAPDRVLLVCRPTSFHASGAQEWFRKTLGDGVCVFSDFASNPKEEDVYRGIERFQSIRAEAVLAVGGGSVLDMAKLINFFGSRHIRLDEYLASAQAISTPLRPLLAVPTTAGSGSEATHFAVVYRQQAKHSVADEGIQPSHVLLAPEFTWSMGAYPTACSGMDALSQSIESCWAREATAESRQHAQEALRLARGHLVAAVNAPTPEHRAAMLEAAHLAGRAIDISKTTGAHAFSYALTSAYGLPHGHAVGLLLPYFVGHHQRAGVSVENIDESFIRDLLRDIQLDRRIPVPADEIHGILTRQVNLERLANNPVAVDEAFVWQVARGLSGE